MTWPEAGWQGGKYPDVNPNQVHNGGKGGKGGRGGQGGRMPPPNPDNPGGGPTGGRRGTGKTDPPPATDPGTLDPTQQNAYDAMLAMFETYGIGKEIAAELRNLIIKGYTGADLNSMLQTTEAYKNRFSGNQIRLKNGLPVLDPGTYLQIEAQYKNVLDNFGLPKGFKDSPDALANWIGNAVSPNEVAGRISMAEEKLANADPQYKDALKNLYGMANGDLLAFILDGKEAMPIIQRRVQAVDFGAAQERQGLHLADTARAEAMGSLNLSDQQLRSGLGAVSENLDTANKLSAIDKTKVGQTDLEDAFLASDATATKKVNKLASRERARFSGGSAIGNGSLATNLPNQY